jgi:hypothetical protein
MRITITLFLTLSTLIAGDLTAKSTPPPQIRAGRDNARTNRGA